MDELIRQLRDAYKNRDISCIETLLGYFHEDVYVIGTSLGELLKGKEALKDLFDSDFRYWVDIDISADYTKEIYGEYVVYELSATGLYTFNMNDKYYHRYVGYMKQIQEEDRSEYSKAIKVMWELDHVLASKPKVKHKDYKKIQITMVEKNNRIQLISYEFKKEKNHIDCAIGIENEMKEYYLMDLSQLNDDKEFSTYIMKNLHPDELSFTELKAEQKDELFFGCGKLKNTEKFEDELRKDYEILDQDISSYQKLYRLRRNLGETLRLYSIGDTQEIMVRFFGLIMNHELAYVHHSYPFYYIFED